MHNNFREHYEIATVDQILNLPRHTLVRYKGKIARTILRELTARGKPGINRVSYRIEYALQFQGKLLWGTFAAVKAPARNLEVLASEEEGVKWSTESK